MANEIAPTHVQDLLDQLAQNERAAREAVPEGWFINPSAQLWGPRGSTGPSGISDLEKLPST